MVEAPTGLAPEVPRRRYQMQVLSNALREPNLAAPYPLAEGDLHGVRWGIDP